MPLAESREEGGVGMFDCHKTREFLDLYLDNELESVPTKRVAEHLEQCADCRTEFEWMRSQDELLARSIRDEAYDTTKLSAAIEAATIGKGFRLPQLSLPGIPAWVVALGCILIVGLSALFFLPRITGIGLAQPLYQVAATDHRACFKDTAASDWKRSQSDITELATSFLNSRQNIPSTVSGEYRLVRGRICKFNSLSFLHIIYETGDGRHVSLFVGHNAAGLPSGELTEKLAGRDVQLWHVSGVTVFAAADGNRLLFATAPEDHVARSALRSILES